LIKKETGKDFPQNVREQLMMAINAVFGSWNNARAITYRRLNDIKGLLGTAVNIQTMVFGNMGNDCGTGVAFTRNPSTGENKFYGEYLINAQGEDVVAGIRTPQPVENLGKQMPEVYKQLLVIRDKLEKHYRDMQDIEFTVQKGKLYMLQTRNGKRTGPAAVKIAVELVKEKLLTEEQALMKVDPIQLDQLLHKRIDPLAKTKTQAIARGLPASPGAAVGKIVFNAEDAKAKIEEGEKVILVRLETSPEDIEGMHVSQGILTARGGMTSHAAVVARGMGKCCVAGCSELIINERAKTLTIKSQVFKEGDYLTLDGSTGEVFKDKLAVIDPILAGEFATLMQWARKYKKLGIRTNADTPKDAKIARDFGAEGIGLTRTEHMFFEGSRIDAMREMILADNQEGRKKALAKLLPYQRQDFEGIFKVMNNLPVIIRFLDPPLHEFLPKEEKEIQALSKIIKVSVEKIKQRTQELHEFNPMLGFRGCRLGIVYPEISEMQARAIFEAAINVKKQNITPLPEIEIPNIIHVKEFKLIKDIVKRVAQETGADKLGIKYKIGTMIEFPRAAFNADELATEAEFMSFGTNDLTQTTLGFSRDDAGRFIPSYLEKNIFEKDPFQTIDQEGVGKVMELAIKKARSIKPNLDIGICGEHGGDPTSVKFCHKINLSNVSCSPFRVPIATLAAAQAVIEDKQKNNPQPNTQNPQKFQNSQTPQNLQQRTQTQVKKVQVIQIKLQPKPQNNQKQNPQNQQNQQKNQNKNLQLNQRQVQQTLQQRVQEVIKQAILNAELRTPIKNKNPISKQHPQNQNKKPLQTYQPKNPQQNQQNQRINNSKLQNNQQNQQKNQINNNSNKKQLQKPQGSISIRDEIRRVVREELSRKR
jgi:pyruvate,orthophosphate dikinase